MDEQCRFDFGVGYKICTSVSKRLKKYVIDSRNQLKYILWSVEEVISLDSWDERAATFSEVSAESCADHSLQRKLTLKSQTIRNRLQVIERFKQKPARLTSITCDSPDLCRWQGDHRCPCLLSSVSSRSEMLK